jgi:hypothetical protein
MDRVCDLFRSLIFEARRGLDVIGPEIEELGPVITVEPISLEPIGGLGGCFGGRPSPSGVD